MTMIEFFKNPAVLWFLIGLFFALIELFVPGLILIFFGIGAWLTALMCFLLPIGTGVQIMVFISTSVITLVLFRKWFNNLLFKTKAKESISDDDELTGKTGVAETDFQPNTPGKVSLNGSLWKAESDVPISAGERVEIIAKKNITLIIKPIKNK
jgi:membrane protein implicated in regulation of membrane protease activity